MRRTKEECTLEEGIASSLGIETLQSLGYGLLKATRSIILLGLDQCLELHRTKLPDDSDDAVTKAIPICTSVKRI